MFLFGKKKLASREARKNEMSEFFDNRDEDFLSLGIMKLPSKFAQVIEYRPGEKKSIKTICRFGIRIFVYFLQQVH